MNKHVVTWFEIPVEDITRASKFYSHVLGVELHHTAYGPTSMAIFPAEGGSSEPTVHGALVKGEGYTPSDIGPLLYFNAGRDLAEPLSRIEAAGGTVLQPKMSIGEHGFIAIFRDTEGNRVALHSPE